MGFINTIEKTICTYSLVERDDKVLVGISGGGDSVALAYVLNILKDRYGFEIYWAHYNYGLRGKESDQEESYVQELSCSWGIKLEIGHPSEVEFSSLISTKSENLTRMLRYNFFRELGKKLGANKLAIGHTASDQAETILMRIIRGTSATGLKGMEPKTPEGIIRPFIEVTRDNVREFLEKQGLKYCHDSSNDSMHYFRNRIRNIILPLLEKENPNVAESLIRLGKTIQHLEQWVMPMVLAEEKRSILSKSSAKIVFDHEILLGYPFELRSRMLKRAWESIFTGNRDKQVETKHLLSVNNLLGQHENKYWQLHLPGQVYIERNNDKIIVSKKSSLFENSPPGLHVLLLVPGETVIPGNLGKIVSQWLPLKNFNNQKTLLTNNNCYLDESVKNKNLVIRFRQPGDWFRSLRTGKSRKLKKYFIDRKIPRDSRDTIPLLAMDNEILWIIGLEQCARYPSSSGSQDTGKVLELCLV